MTLQPEPHDDRTYQGWEVRMLERAAYQAGKAAQQRGGLDGRAVHAAWRDGMLRQGRVVADERMTWDTLTEQDRELDEWIAARLAPQPSVPPADPEQER